MYSESLNPHQLQAEKLILRVTVEGIVGGCAFRLFNVNLSVYANVTLGVDASQSRHRPTRGKHKVVCQIFVFCHVTCLVEEAPRVRARCFAW